VAWTLAQYQSLCAALAEGALSIQYFDRDGGQRRIQYRSNLDEMYDLKRRMERELGIVPDLPARRYAQYESDLAPGDPRTFH